MASVTSPINVKGPPCGYSPGHACDGRVVLGPQPGRGCLMTTVKLLRRQFLHLAAGAAALPVFPRIAGAQPSGAGAKKGTRVVTLGTRSGPTPDRDRAQSSNALIT